MWLAGLVVVACNAECLARDNGGSVLALPVLAVGNWSVALAHELLRYA